MCKCKWVCRDSRDEAAFFVFFPLSFFVLIINARFTIPSLKKRRNWQCSIYHRYATTCNDIENTHNSDGFVYSLRNSAPFHRERMETWNGEENCGRGEGRRREERIGVHRREFKTCKRANAWARLLRAVRGTRAIHMHACHQWSQ